MKNNFYKILVITSFIFSIHLSISAAAPGKLFVEPKIYFTGEKTDLINPGKDSYVNQNSSIELKKSDALNCENQTCEYNIGLIVSKTDNDANLSAIGLVQTDSRLTGQIIPFDSKDKVKQIILPVKLNVGANKVTIIITPQDAETAEDSNNFSVTINVVS